MEKQALEHLEITPQWAVVLVRSKRGQKEKDLKIKSPTAAASARYSYQPAHMLHLDTIFAMAQIVVFLKNN